MARDPFGDSPELTVLSREPMVAGVPLNLLDSPEMSNKRFFVRNHFPIPKIDASKWRLSVSGEVGSDLSLSYQDLKELAQMEVLALLECAGNSRAAVQPPIEGLLWDHGGVGTAAWAGVPLATILELAGVQPSAKEVLLEGDDRGTEPEVTGELGYAMSLPMEKALHPDTLLALEMNGEQLAPEHGYPLRVVVPGWYGMVSVKWLSKIRLLNHGFEGYHQSDYYVFVHEGVENGLPKERVTSMPVKSLISQPGRGESLSLGHQKVRGVAWSGQGPISQVEVSTDNGRTWHPAQVDASASPYAWQKWEYNWRADKPGYFLIRARATDQNGNVQPDQFVWNFRGFANNSIHVVPVLVR